MDLKKQVVRCKVIKKKKGLFIGPLKVLNGVLGIGNPRPCSIT